VPGWVLRGAGITCRNIYKKALPHFGEAVFGYQLSSYQQIDGAPWSPRVPNIPSLCRKGTTRTSSKFTHISDLGRTRIFLDAMIKRSN
jgi:hypothetical protein